MENNTTKIGDKLTKVNDSFTVNMYDNGFMLEIGGVDSDDNWKNCKILCNSVEELVALIQEASGFERRD